MVAHLLIAALGVVAGIVFGAIPGMTATMAVAVFLPMTYAYDMETASWACMWAVFPEDWYRQF